MGITIVSEELKFEYKLKCDPSGEAKLIYSRMNAGSLKSQEFSKHFDEQGSPIDSEAFFYAVFTKYVHDWEGFYTVTQTGKSKKPLKKKLKCDANALKSLRDLSPVVFTEIQNFVTEKIFQSTDVDPDTDFLSSKNGRKSS